MEYNWQKMKGWIYVLSTGPPNSNIGMFIQYFTTIIEESITGKHELIIAVNF